MPTEAGYSNTLKQGRTRHKTLHSLGSSVVGQMVVSKALSERNAIPAAVTAVEVNQSNTLIKLTLASHGAIVGDVVRFYSGPLQGAELEVVSVVDTNNFIIRNVVGVPAVGNTVKVMFYVTQKTDAEGNINFSPGPATYVRDNVSTVVAEDTSNAANNRSLPTLITFYKDGIQRPVLEDTVTPANTDPLPVKLVGLTGDINITAGDLNVAVDATNDSVAIGDSVTGNKAVVSLNSDTTTYALKVKDDDANLLLADIETAVLGIGSLSGIATEATLADVKTAVESIALEDFATETTLGTRASESTLGDVKTAVQLLDDTVNTDGNPSGTKGLLIGGVDGNGDFQVASVNPAGELSVTFSSAGFATETTLTALNNKHNADFGASTGAIRTAAQIGNATGVADFGVGVDGAQTLRVSANLKRAGNELSYNSGTADANTQRVVLATRHESDNTPIATRLSNGSNWITDTTIANSQKTISGGANRALEVVSLALGWDGSNHREMLVDSTGKVITTEAPLTASFSELLNITNTAQTITAPAGAKWAKVMCPTTNVASLRIKFGGTATTTSGMQMQPGRSEDFNAVGNLSVICEDASTNQEIIVQWGA